MKYRLITFFYSYLSQRWSAGEQGKPLYTLYLLLSLITSNVGKVKIVDDLPGLTTIS